MNQRYFFNFHLVKIHLRIETGEMKTESSSIYRYDIENYNQNLKVKCMNHSFKLHSQHYVYTQESKHGIII